MTPIADIDRIARCVGNRTQYPWRFSKLFVPQLRASQRSKRKRSRDNCRLLTPSLPLSRSPDLPVCLARIPAARLWLKDVPPSPQGYGATRSLEDTANLAGLSSMPGFPRHTQNLDASRRKVGSRFLRAANARSRHHRAGDRQISLSLD